MFLLFDIGSTRMRVGVSEDLAKLDRYEIYNTPRDYRAALELVKSFAGEEKIQRVAGCIPGFVSKDGVIERSGNLPEWRGEKIVDDLVSIFGIKPMIDNDAVLANLGEWEFGAGKGADHLAYLTISTGIGGSITYQGKVLPRLTSFEPGQQIIYYKDRIERMENIASGRMILSRYGGGADKLSNEEAWVEIEKNLSILIHNLICFWSPERLVLGGGVVEFGKLNFDRISASLESTLPKIRIPQILPAELGAIGGLYGGLYLLRNIRTLV